MEMNEEAVADGEVKVPLHQGDTNHGKQNGYHTQPSGGEERMCDSCQACSLMQRCNAVAYFGTTLIFFVFALLRVIPRLWYPTTENLLPLEWVPEWLDAYIVLMIMWGLHYMRRFAEVFFLHDYRRPRPVFEAVGVIVYYWFFGLWNGWAANPWKGYQATPLCIFIPGVVLYIVGQIGNFYFHIQMRKLRPKRPPQIVEDTGSGTSTSSIIDDSMVQPTGGLFNYVACPHYLFEIITWFGFALASFTLAAFTFWLCATITMTVRGRKRLAQYRNTWPNDYEKDRRKTAILPFIC